MSNGDRKKDKASADYKIGDKCPPKLTQFKPGVSGNPKGRPKGSVNLRTRITRHLRTMATVSRNGKMVKVLKAELVAQQVVDAAAKGDLKAGVYVIRLDDEAAMAISKCSTEEGFELPNEENLRFILHRLRGLVGEDE